MCISGLCLWLVVWAGNPPPLELAGKWQESLGLAQSQEAAAAATGFVPIQAHTRSMVGHMLERLGRHEESIEAMRDALELSLQGNEDELAAGRRS